MEFKDLAGLSGPATKLIEVIAKATGVVFEPTRIKREARAQAEALLVRTGAEIEADDLRRRAADRFFTQEVKKQENLESVLGQTVPLVSAPPTSKGDIDADWINRFVLEVQEVSDERLQAVWARLLAGEFQSPGAFPRRLFRVLKDLEPKEAAVIDGLAGKVLHVELSDGSVAAFLNSHIRQEWRLGQQREEEVVAEAPVADIAFLKEHGLVEHGDFIFDFAVEGPLDPGKIHLSRFSARKIFTAKEQIVPSHIQPNFVRTKGPTMTPEGQPQINAWIKQVTFDAWKVTPIGESMFSLTNQQPDPRHLEWIRGQLLSTGIALRS